MTRRETAPLDATSLDPSPFAIAQRVLARGGLVAALASRAERSDRTSPRQPDARMRLGSTPTAESAERGTDATNEWWAEIASALLMDCFVHVALPRCAE
jgi:hypothetical protein